MNRADDAAKNAISSKWLGLPPTMSSELFSRATGQELKAGDVLFEAGDEGDGCYRLETGSLKVLLRSPQGAERILALLTPDAVVGDLSMIDGLPRSATVIAVSDCKLCFISRALFRDFAERHPEIYRYFTTLLAGRLRGTDGTIAALEFLTWKGRVAHFLLELADNWGTPTGSGTTVINSMISQRELAAMAGVARENVSRVLNVWKRSKIISLCDHSLQIHDKSALQQEMETLKG
jgi:CRP/FNR family transcriptional regulator, cyclic AMP receptor protein